MKRKLLVLVVVLVSLWAAACSATQNRQVPGEMKGEKISVPGGAYTNINATELHTMLENKDFVFVNTHIPFEGELPKTDLSISFDQIGQNLDQLPADKDAKIVLYCRSDRMSGIASETLVESGYTNVWNLEGGMVAWEKAGYLLEGK